MSDPTPSRTDHDDLLDERLYVDIETAIHQHMGHDGQSDETNDWVTDLMSALSPHIVRALAVERERADQARLNEDAALDAHQQVLAEVNRLRDRLLSAEQQRDEARTAMHAYMADLIAVTNRAEKAETAIAALRNGVHRWAASWLANVPTAARRYAELRVLLDSEAEQ